MGCKGAKPDTQIQAAVYHPFWNAKNSVGTVNYSIQCGPKNGLFLRVDNFARVSVRKACYAASHLFFTRKHKQLTTVTDLGVRYKPSVQLSRHVKIETKFYVTAWIC